MRSFLFFTFWIVTIPAEAQFVPYQKKYQEWEGYEKYWDQIHKYRIKLDTAFYEDGSIAYTKSDNGTTGTFTKYYPYGKIHILGENRDVIATLEDVVIVEVKRVGNEQTPGHKAPLGYVAVLPRVGDETEYSR